MRRATLPILAALAAVVAFATALVLVWPAAREAGALLLSQDDPAALSDLRLETLLADHAAVARQIDDALAAGDSGLAQSFVELAGAKGVALPDATVTRVADAVTRDQSAAHLASQFASGLIKGEANDLASLSGTVTGDLLVIGDVRDVIHQGTLLATGAEPDRVVLGLATAGIAVTAATYMSAGGAAPVRAGLTLVKDARKAGRIGTGLATWMGRSAREVVDAPELEKAIASASVLSPGASAGALRAAFRADKAGALLRTAKDVGRVGEKAGARGALDTLRVAEGPDDIARAARLAESKGGQTRAILKLLGRGALLLAAGAFDLALWVIGALFAVFGLLASIKAASERATHAWLRHARRRRLRRIAELSAHGSTAAAQPSTARPHLALQG